MLLCGCISISKDPAFIAMSQEAAGPRPPALEPVVEEGEVVHPDREAVDPAAVGTKVAATYQRHNNTLCRLHWKMRTRLQMEGTPVLEVLHSMRLDEHGDVHRTLRQTRSRSDGRGVLVAQAADPQRLEQTEMLADLVHAYTHTLSGKLIQGMKTASWHPAPKPKGAWHCTLTDVLVPGDQAQVTAWPNGDLIDIQFHSLPDTQPCTGTITFRALPDGTTYPATTIIQVHQQPLQATVECFQYRSF